MTHHVSDNLLHNAMELDYVIGLNPLDKPELFQFQQRDSHLSLIFHEVSQTFSQTLSSRDEQFDHNTVRIEERQNSKEIDSGFTATSNCLDCHSTSRCDGCCLSAAGS